MKAALLFVSAALTRSGCGGMLSAMPLHLQTAWEFQKRFACSILKWNQRSDEQKYDRFDLFENNVFGRVAQERAPSRLNRYSNPASLQKKRDLFLPLLVCFLGLPKLIKTRTLF